MARKTKTIVITDEGRDKDKAFLIQEMPPTQAERWGMRALLALAKTMDVPDETMKQGIGGVASIGIGKMISNLSFEDADSLMKEMFDACVYIIPDVHNQTIFRGPPRHVTGIMPVGPLVEDDIEEVTTRLKLRLEIFALHVGFSLPAIDWSLITSSLKEAPVAGSPLQNTKMSQDQ